MNSETAKSGSNDSYTFLTAQRIFQGIIPRRIIYLRNDSKFQTVPV